MPKLGHPFVQISDESGFWTFTVVAFKLTTVLGGISERPSEEREVGSW